MILPFYIVVIMKHSDSRIKCAVPSCNNSRASALKSSFFRFLKKKNGSYLCYLSIKVIHKCSISITLPRKCLQRSNVISLSFYLGWKDGCNSVELTKKM
jgi:hypothetical protein